MKIHGFRNLWYLQGDKYVSERFEEVLVRLCIDSEKFFFYKKDCLGIYLLKVIKQILLQSQKRDHLNTLVIKHICQDLQPISVVEQKGFQNLVKRLDSKYLLPNRKTVVKLLKNIRLDPP